jgi:hypothetical protein
MLHPRQRKELWDLRQRQTRRLPAFQDGGRSLRREECKPKRLTNDLPADVIITTSESRFSVHTTDDCRS